MTTKEMIEANKASALEALKERERNDDLIASNKAIELINERQPRKFTFIGQQDRRDEAIREVQRESVEVSRQTNYHE